mmetsp:Transcript_18146/g.42410  ORF Transcript_18146/g.42410 Transcript_18146/m.42410 type:complete len:693 (+) Transcript_18146:75-2153(+)
MARSLPSEAHYAPLPEDSRDAPAAYFQEDDNEKRPQSSSRKLSSTRCFIPCVLLAVVYVCWALLVLFAATIGVQYGAKESRWQEDIFAANGKLWTPANLSRLYKQEMPSCGGFELLSAYDTFSAAHPWKRVNFPSRQGPDGQSISKLSAWWLPADDPAHAPRVVVVHPGDENFNSHRVQIVSYFLRTLGFSVLAPNLRDHGTSEGSNHQGAGWGYDYPFDVLGAWDYAVTDPDGSLDGSCDPSQVGLLGFSGGAYAAAVAFGIETRIPGLWVDSMVFDYSAAVSHRLQSTFLGLLGPLLQPVAWYLVQSVAGVDVALYSPQGVLSDSELEDGSDGRSVAILHGALDEIVLKEQSETFAQLLQDSSCFKLEAFHSIPYDCSGEHHALMHLWRPAEYRARLAAFWSSVFDTHLKMDKLHRLPLLPDCAEDTCSTVHVPAASMSSLPEDACSDFVELDLVNARVTTRTQHEGNPGAVDVPELAFDQVATVNGRILDLLVFSSSDYTPATLGEPENGKLGPFGSLSMKCGHRANFTFKFVETETVLPVVLPRFFFTVLDIDAPKINSEWIMTSGLPRFAVSPDSAMLMSSVAPPLQYADIHYHGDNNEDSEEDSGHWPAAFRASPGIVSRPSSATALGGEAGQHAVTFFFEGLSEFSLTFAVSDCSGIAEDDGTGGQILFTGVTDYACPARSQAAD